MGTVHVIGAGLSGLSCALRVALAGRDVALYEAAGHAGGRCRSFHDESLGCLIDNGSHMMLGANEATRAYLADIGSEEAVTEIAPAVFPFRDVASGQTWRIAPGAGMVPFWLLSSERRVPGATWRDYLSVTRLARADGLATVRDCVGSDGALYDCFWQPLSRAVLNTDASEASARLLWRVIKATFLRGEQACRPYFFHDGLSPALIDPAIATLSAAGAAIRMQARLRGITWRDGRASLLHFAEGPLRIGDDGIVVLAVPPEVCAELLPGTTVPQRSNPIVNAHFRLDRPVELPFGMPFLGLIGTTSQWLFARGNLVSVTVSAAEDLIDRPGWELANILWAEVAGALGRNLGRVPPWRIIKERRATFAQTPDEITRRPATRTPLKNVLLAGDWTDTGLPATIEGSIRSGFHAAQLALADTTAPRAA